MSVSKRRMAKYDDWDYRTLQAEAKGQKLKKYGVNSRSKKADIARALRERDMDRQLGEDGECQNSGTNPDGFKVAADPKRWTEAMDIRLADAQNRGSPILP